MRESENESLVEGTKARIQYLITCREYLRKFCDLGFDKKLIDKQARDEYQFRHGDFEKKLRAYEFMREEHLANYAVYPYTDTPVQRWMDDLEELEAAEAIVSSLDIDPYDWKFFADQKKMMDELRDLWQFDDSE